MLLTCDVVARDALTCDVLTSDVLAPMCGRRVSMLRVLTLSVLTMRASRIGRRRRAADDAPRLLGELSNALGQARDFAARRGLWPDAHLRRAHGERLGFLQGR